jgi:hypothetical protein
LVCASVSNLFSVDTAIVPPFGIASPLFITRFTIT